ncbi:MAG: phosphomannose isomerase type II C-terminal cupin domain [Pseudanabaenaceae cyanobacterium]
MSEEAIHPSPYPTHAPEVGGGLAESPHSSSQTHHATVRRPWGSFTVLEEGKGYKIKRIEVMPNHRLSLQMHHHRSEHWIVVSGTAKVTCGDREILIGSNESTYVPRCTPHRLANPGTIPLIIIEVQNGEYLGEDDIVRFQDDYARANPLENGR